MSTPVVHARPQGEPDPLFEPVKAHFGNPDFALASASLLGRIGGDLANPISAHAAAFATLQRIFSAVTERFRRESGRSWIRRPRFRPKRAPGLSVSTKGPLQDATRCTDDFILEFAEGMPMSDVGWGRVSRADLTELLEIHSLYFNLTQATFYPAQVQVSNLASHILDTLEQGATGRAVPGALCGPAGRLVVVVGHDSNLASLAGLMGVSWWMEGTQRDPVLPGGALVFELRRSRSDGRNLVRLHYVCQTLEQMRSGETLTLRNPPPTAPIFIPGCSAPTPGYDAPLDRVETLLHRVIDPAYVTPSSD